MKRHYLSDVPPAMRLKFLKREMDFLSAELERHKQRFSRYLQKHMKAVKADMERLDKIGAKLEELLRETERNEKKRP